MARKNHLAKLSKGVEVWNAWRVANPDVRPELGQTNLARADLRTVNFAGADLSHSVLEGADLRHAILVGADLRGVDLRGARLRGAFRPNGVYVHGADLSQANLEDAYLGGANLFDVSFHHANLSRADLSYANVYNADLRDADLSGAYIVDSRLPASILEARDLSFTVIDWRTVARSIHLDGLQSVLERSGMPTLMATYLIDSARSIDAIDLFTMMQTVFVCCDDQNGEFVRRLRSDLLDNGIRNFFFPRGRVPADGVSSDSLTSARPYDRMILVCSEATLSKPGVLDEVTQVLERERTEGESMILVPILTENDIFDRGPPPWWPTDRRGTYGLLAGRVCADFRRALEGAPHVWSDEVGKLLEALRKIR